MIDILQTLPISGIWDILIVALTILALDILSPPWPTAELAILLPLKKFFGIPLVVGELIAQGLAIVILVVVWFRYNDLLMPLLGGIFDFFSFTAFGIPYLGVIITVVMASVFAVAAYYFN